MRYLVSFAMLAAIALASVPIEVYATVEVGQNAPALVVPELNGQTFDLSAERGNVVVINFWATWCEPCRDEMPALDAFYRRHRDQGMAVIGISADRPHDRSEVAKAAQSVSYPVAMMRDAASNGFNSPTTLPTTYIVDRDGTVRAKLTPEQTRITEGTLDTMVLPLLSHKPPS